MLFRRPSATAHYPRHRDCHLSMPKSFRNDPEMGIRHGRAVNSRPAAASLRLSTTASFFAHGLESLLHGARQRRVGNNYY